MLRSETPARRGDDVQYYELQTPAMQLEQPVAEVAGRGRYAGLCIDLGGRPDPQLGIFATAQLTFLEGDFRANVDGALALDGTGTEDYPDSSFYFRETPAATPFAQNWGLVDMGSAMAPGQVSFGRWQVLGNEVDFQREFSAIHEIAMATPSVIYLHRTMAYLYLP